MLALGVAAGAYFAYRYVSDPAPSVTNTRGNGNASNRERPSDAPAARKEVLRYSVTRQLPDGSWAPPETGDAPIATGQPFKFHFVAPDGGYLYILTTTGPGVTPTTFLTNEPVPGSGVTTNRLEPGREFEFPGGERALRLTAQELHSPYMFVLSKEPLTDPTFFAATAQRSLLAKEQAELEDFIRAHQGKQAQSAPSDGHSPPVVVTMPTGQEGDGPMVYQFTITAAIP
jgi:hypothetical protein